MNDLCAFDLNQLQMPNNRWEMLVPNGEAGPDPSPQARTNHTMVTFNDKLYLYVPCGSGVAVNLKVLTLWVIGSVVPMGFNGSTTYGAMTLL